MSFLLNKLEHGNEDYILVSETLELLSKATKNSPIADVKTYLLANDIEHHMPVFYRDDCYKFDYDASEENRTIDDGFYCTYRTLATDLTVNGYFLIESLNEFKPIQEYDIFAYKRGYHYIAKQPIEGFNKGDYVVGLADETCKNILQKGLIEKVLIEQPIHDTTEHQKLGEYQELLTHYELFTPEQIVCLMIDENPALINYDNKFLAHLNIVSTAIDAGTLTPINDERQIVAEQVKSWLAKSRFIYRDFNDNLLNDTNNLYQLNIGYQKRIVELEQEAEDAKNTGSFSMGTPTVEHGEDETYEQLVEALTAANNTIRQQEEDINRLNEQLKEQEDNLADKHLYDWQAMNQYNYPPELHLAMIIWEKIYILNEIGNQHITDHSQRFNIIAKKVGLDKAIHGEALINRLGKITNPQSNKPKNDVKNLKVIKELNIKDLDNSNLQG